jgi:hypothetical protein
MRWVALCNTRTQEPQPTRYYNPPNCIGYRTVLYRYDKPKIQVPRTRHVPTSTVYGHSPCPTTLAHALQINLFLEITFKTQMPTFEYSI